MPDSSNFEVRCEPCKSSFAIGTKRCIHCGGALGQRLLAFDARSGTRAGGAPPAALKAGTPDAQPNLGRVLRFALIALGVLVALARAFLQDR